MNQPSKHEGFVKNAEPVEPDKANGPVIEHEATPRPAATPAEPFKETWPVKVKLLHKPIRGASGTTMVSELSFREPTGGDINRYGNPVHIDQNGEVVILDKKMTTMMAALSGILQPFIETMDPRDWNSAAYRLRNFFIPDTAAW